MAFSELPTRYHLNCCFPRFFSSAILRDFQATLFLKSKSLLISSRGLSWSLACGSIKGHKNGNEFLTAANVKNWQRSRRCPKSRETFNFTKSSRFLELQVTSKTAEMLMHEKM